MSKDPEDPREPIVLFDRTDVPEAPDDEPMTLTDAYATLLAWERDMDIDPHDLEEAIRFATGILGAFLDKDTKDQLDS